MTKVSIIIPVYNVSSYIEESLLHALNQTYDNIEYIIVDDCGTDDSITKVKRIKQNSTRDIKIIKHSKNSGVSVARNTGIQHSSGEFIFFMDSDDVITANCIELHVKAIMETNADFTIGGIDIVGSQSIHINKIDNNILQDDYILIEFFNRKWDNGPCNKLIRREFIFCNGLFFQEGIRYEDILWGYNLSKRARKVRLFSDFTYKYIIHKGSFVTSKNTHQKVSDLIYVLKEIESDSTNDRYLDYRNKWLSFWKFNAAILLLNFEGDTSIRKDLYKSIKSIKSKKNLYHLLLELPFYLFYIVFNTPYYLYKTLNLK